MGIPKKVPCEDIRTPDRRSPIVNSPQTSFFLEVSIQLAIVLSLRDWGYGCNNKQLIYTPPRGGQPLHTYGSGV